jgi:hypothetical protein
MQRNSPSYRPARIAKCNSIELQYPAGKLFFGHAQAIDQWRFLPLQFSFCAVFQRCYEVVSGSTLGKPELLGIIAALDFLNERHE